MFTLFFLSDHILSAGLRGGSRALTGSVEAHRSGEALSCFLLVFHFCHAFAVLLQMILWCAFATSVARVLLWCLKGLSEGPSAVQAVL